MYKYSGGDIRRCMLLFVLLMMALPWNSRATHSFPAHRVFCTLTMFQAASSILYLAELSNKQKGLEARRISLPSLRPAISDLCMSLAYVHCVFFLFCQFTRVGCNVGKDVTVIVPIIFFFFCLLRL